jgi:hypothetical protein
MERQLLTIFFILFFFIGCQQLEIKEPKSIELDFQKDPEQQVVKDVTYSDIWEYIVHK